MKKIILGIVFVFASFTMVNASSDVEIKDKTESVEIVEKSSPSDCVGFARNLVLDHADAGGMDSSAGSDDYNYLMGLYHMLYSNCLEDIGYL